MQIELPTEAGKSCGLRSAYAAYKPTVPRPTANAQLSYSCCYADCCAGPGGQSRPNLDALPSFPCAKLKLDQLFLQWLSENQTLVSATFAPPLRSHRAPTMLD